MSQSDNGNNGSSMNRQVAKRAFATEFEDASHIFQAGSSERSPKFAMLPSGEAASRVLIVGTLTECEDISKNSDSEYWQARVVDPTGTFFVYAGKYQQEAMGALRGIEAPEYVAIVGKPRSYETDDGDMLVSVTPESITTVEEGTRDQWVVETAEQTLERIDAMEDVDVGAEASANIERAHEAYGEDLDLGQYAQGAKEALAQVAGIDIAESEVEDDDGEEDTEE
ncbi:nucleic acid-binding protein [Halococcus salsus]|uniref:nucleic acid-binding protein n=1 Tax=Halococcus salsus TaxID=2162894 RepID=UPI0018656F95|nr:nucleic acid-binding protein [Halococcus salsus]